MTSPIVRILESIIKKLFAPSQHGFIGDRLCAAQLLIEKDYWTQSLNDGYPVDIIYLDFHKVFDLVPHNQVLTKLKVHGISGCLLDWVWDLLSGRKQRVLNGDHSS